MLQKTVFCQFQIDKCSFSKRFFFQNSYWLYLIFIGTKNDMSAFVQLYILFFAHLRPFWLYFLHCGTKPYNNICAGFALPTDLGNEVGDSSPKMNQT